MPLCITIQRYRLGFIYTLTKMLSLLGYRYIPLIGSSLATALIFNGAICPMFMDASSHMFIGASSHILIDAISHMFICVSSHMSINTNRLRLRYRWHFSIFVSGGEITTTRVTACIFSNVNFTDGLNVICFLNIPPIQPPLILCCLQSPRR